MVQKRRRGIDSHTTQRTAGRHNPTSAACQTGRLIYESVEVVFEKFLLQLVNELRTFHRNQLSGRWGR
jgi:hypothetical protein